MHINIHTIIPTVISVLVAWWIAFRDVKLSAKLMLALEFISVILILIVSFIVLVKNGFQLHLAQFHFKGFTAASIRGGLMLGFFSYVGFESATTLGDEAKNPLKTIPRAVLMSVILVGAFFMFTSYAEVLGFAGAASTLDQSDAPFNYIAVHCGVGYLSPLISLGAVISMWGCMLASLNAASRIFFAMSRHGLFPSSMGDVHGENATPHVTVHICSVVVMIILGAMVLHNVKPFDICGWLGTLSSFGFLVAYILISIAAPVALWRAKRLQVWNVLVSLLAIGICGMALVSCVYPVPAAPASYFVYIFLGYMAIGVLILLAVHRRSPDIIHEIAADLDLVQENFRQVPVTEVAAV